MGTQPTDDVAAAARAAMAKWKVPSSVQIAQYAEESGWGHHLPPGSNNPFGIKARLSAKGVPIDPYVIAGTDEQNFNGQAHWHGPQPFRKFSSIADAFDYHAQLLATASAYAPAMAKLPEVVAFVSAMAPHYATATNYAAELMKIINGSNLMAYDHA
jgi:flagellum-specific peptidoglycan hydrolase FlgJ